MYELFMNTDKIDSVSLNNSRFDVQNVWSVDTSFLEMVSLVVSLVS